MISFADFAKHLERAAAQCVPQLGVGLAKLGEHTLTVATEEFGHELPMWEPLSANTLHGFRHPYGFWIKGKVELGYTGHMSATDPLLRSGKTRDSLEVAVEGLTQAVGSQSKIMLYQEMGTHNSLTGDIPPRPAIAIAAIGSLPYAEEVFGEIGIKLLTPGGFK